MRGQFRPQNAVQLPVAVLLDDVDPFVTLHERCNIGCQRKRANTEVIRLDARVMQPITRFDDCMMRRAERDDSDAVRRFVGDGLRDRAARSIVLTRQPVQVAPENVRILRLARVFVVT